MTIVPAEDDLVIDANVAPQDIDQVSVGQQAIIRFTAFNRRLTPEVRGIVQRIAADALTDKSEKRQFYLTRIKFGRGDLADLGDVKLVPGMPAEVFIQTGERTLFSYLSKPISDQLFRSLREK